MISPAIPTSLHWLLVKYLGDKKETIGLYIHKIAPFQMPFVLKKKLSTQAES
jgi:hypothetical protein